jgi:uncharacterized protein (DUF924 family)
MADSCAESVKITSMNSAAEVLSFWFEQHGQDDWFGAKPEFDAAIAEHFTDTHAALARGEGWAWRATPPGRLAEIIVLDQFSRQLFRGRPGAFVCDSAALALAQEAVGGGHHQFLPPDRRTFFLMPFMHSESRLMQQESVRLFTALGLEGHVKYARGHAEVIERFGRFPKRNEALGRASSPEEAEYCRTTEGMA